ncbi:hypothetical protein BDQ17DRAFT_1338394 [Cyathus striatus]|nr:hypothetical protein BDQ17DRAFT_1338394 [Cyathus striatus]
MWRTLHIPPTLNLKALQNIINLLHLLRGQVISPAWLKLKATKGTEKTVAHATAFPKKPPKNAKLIRATHGMFTSFLEFGAIHPNRVEVLPNGLHGVSEGLKCMENSQVSAVKLIVHPDETD